MSRSRPHRALLFAALLLLPAAWVAKPALPATAATPAEEGAAPRRGPLGVRAASWVFPARPLEVTLDQRGVLAGRRLAIDLFIDGNQLERVATKADRTVTRLPTPALAPGRHVLMAKAGREIATTEFRVIAWSWLAGGAVGLLALAAASLAFARARVRSRGLAA